MSPPAEPPQTPAEDAASNARDGSGGAAVPQPEGGAGRDAALHRWLAGLPAALGLQVDALQPASADASFRRYLRLPAAVPGGTLVVMDAPPALEDVRPFVRVAALLRQAGLHAPRVLAADEAQGLLLLDDLGRRPYLAALRQAQAEAASADAATAAAGAATADRLMRAALDALVQLQRHVPAQALPPFDAAAIQRELDLFPQWCVAREHGLAWGAAEQRAWDLVCTRLKAALAAQPQVAVHADWMPRNLMVCDDLVPEAAALSPRPLPGVLDFQDAVRGPLAYDLASLLRDAFIGWDEAQELDWAVRWWQQARAAGLPVPGDFADFWRDLEWTGLQRHLKVLGIFCRLKHRDGKPAYAADLPRFFGYATRTAMRWRELAPLLPLLAPMSGAAVAQGLTF